MRGYSSIGDFQQLVKTTKAEYSVHLFKWWFHLYTPAPAPTQYTSVQFISFFSGESSTWNDTPYVTKTMSLLHEGLKSAISRSAPIPLSSSSSSSSSKGHKKKKKSLHIYNSVGIFRKEMETVVMAAAPDKKKKKKKNTLGPNHQY